MANLRQAIAASESVRMKFLTGKPFSEADVRMELSPSTDLRKQLDEAMQLIHGLLENISKRDSEFYLEGQISEAIFWHTNDFGSDKWGKERIDSLKKLHKEQP